jgi:hypothetical protein
MRTATRMIADDTLQLLYEHHGQLVESCSKVAAGDSDAIDELRLALRAYDDADRENWKAEYALLEEESS